MSFLRSLSRNCSFGNWRGFLSTQYAPNLTCKVALRLQELAGYSVLPRVCHYRTVHRLSTGGAIKKNSKQYMCMWSRSQIAASLLSQNVHEFQANTSFEEQKLSSEEQRETSEEQNASSKKKIPFYQEQSNTLQKKTSKKFGTHNYDFDDNGYLSVDDLIKFLKHEAAFDICVIETSGAQRAYVDFFVVVSGVSNRHIHAMAKNLETLFRGQDVRGVGKDGHVSVEGLGTDNWLALDIGNMALHFFLPETRALYELEKLWTLGPKYDDQYKSLIEEENFLKAVFIGTQEEC